MLKKLIKRSSFWKWKNSRI